MDHGEELPETNLRKGRAHFQLGNSVTQFFFENLAIRHVNIDIVHKIKTRYRHTGAQKS